MEKKPRYETNVFRRGRCAPTSGYLPFKVKYKSRSSTRADKESFNQRFHHHGLPRREHDVQQYKPDITQRTPPTDMADQRRSHFRTCVLNMIIMDLQPTNLVEEEGFQLFMKALDPCTGVPLSASWIQAELLHMYEHTKQKVQEEVTNAKDLVLSAEMWISTKEASYLTITSHIISKNWELKSYMLETAHLLGEHTPDNIHQQLWRISNEWKVMEKVQVVVVNVDGMKKSNLKARWTYIPCFNHTLNKVFREAMDNSVWRDLLKKCHRIVAFFHQDSETLRNVRLTQSPGAEWRPMLTMLREISDQWTSIAEEFMKKQVENLWLNEKERAMLRSAVVALEAIEHVIGEMGTSGYSSVSNIIPLLDKLQRSLGNLEQNGNRVAQKLAERCHHHMGNIKQNLWFTVSTALDPRFKSSAVRNSGAEKIKALIKEEMHKHSHVCSRGYGEQIQAYCQDFVWQRYLAESDSPDTHPLKFWATTKDFKELANVARRYLTVVSTAIPVERVMQQEQSQLIFNRRKCVEMQSVNMMLFLNSNRAETGAGDISE